MVLIETLNPVRFGGWPNKTLVVGQTKPWPASAQGLVWLATKSRRV